MLLKLGELLFEIVETLLARVVFLFFERFSLDLELGELSLDGVDRAG
jgi:hypothetical protein